MRDPATPSVNHAPLSIAIPQGERWKALLLVVLVFAAFAPFTSQGFIWDDDLWVTDNPTLRTWAGLGEIWFRPGSHPQYYPLVQSVFWLEYQAFGLEPLGYHVVNIVLHALSTLLLWRLLSRLNVPGALLGAACFAVHPMQVESVAWITELKNALSCVFYLLAAHTFLSYSELEVGGESRRRWGFYGLTLFLFACAITSKSVTASLPAAILLVSWWKEQRFPWRRVVEVLPMFAAGAGMGVVTAWMEWKFVRATGADWDFTFLERFLIAGRAACFYLAKLVWPHPMAFLYPRWTIDASEAWQYAFPAGILALVGALFLLRGRLGKGPLVALLFYLGTLLPALGFVNVYPMRFSFVANHFAYHALIGPMAALGAGAWLLHRRLTSIPRVAKLVAAIVVGALLLVSTWRQAPEYRDEPTLWRSVLARDPKAWIAHVNLGEDAFRRGDFVAAERHYREVVRLAPHFETAHYNLGTALERLGRLEEAIAEYRAEVAAYPNRAINHVNLGVLLARTGDPRGAEVQLSEGVRLEPTRAEYVCNLGVLYESAGDPNQAATQFLRALELGSTDPRVYQSCARVLVALGRTEEALRTFRALVESRPGDAAARSVLEALSAPRSAPKRSKDSR